MDARSQPRWTRLSVEFLIENIRHHRCLWDPKYNHKSGRKVDPKKGLKRVAYYAIVCLLWENFPELATISAEQVKSKFTTLKSYFMSEYRKTQDTPSGAASGYVTKWEFFEAMSFLKDTLTNDKTQVPSPSSHISSNPSPSSTPVPPQPPSAVCSTPVPPQPPSDVCNTPVPPQPPSAVCSTPVPPQPPSAVCSTPVPPQPPSAVCSTPVPPQPPSAVCSTPVPPQPPSAVCSTPVPPQLPSAVCSTPVPPPSPSTSTPVVSRQRKKRKNRDPIEEECIEAERELWSSNLQQPTQDDFCSGFAKAVELWMRGLTPKRQKTASRRFSEVMESMETE